MKKWFDLVFHRVVIAALLLSVQLYLLVLFLVRFNRYFSTFYISSMLLGVGVALVIINSRHNSATKTGWIFFMMLLPIVGAILYLIFGQSRLTKKQSHRLESISVSYKEAMKSEPDIFEDFSVKYPSWLPLMYYLNRRANSPLYYLDNATYYPVGDEFFVGLLDRLKQATSFIFMQYFIIEEGEMWQQIEAVLIEKASKGVDVRLLYDDFGCLFTLPKNFAVRLRRHGIQCFPFNPLVPVLSIQHNHRDHRKITVIDGNVGFIGGINLADEYINVKVKHGHWKDSAVCIEGNAVHSLTMIFLSSWAFVTKRKVEKISEFLPYTNDNSKDYFTMMFSDSPLDHEAVGETVFLSIIHNAKRYVYITTPYLIVTDELINACAVAAKSGVEVKIFMPGIADKKTVFLISRSHYQPLLEAGVSIFEYSLGFLHAKSLVCDDDIALVGTINLDYRSLYHHFECSGVMIGHPIIERMKEDLANLENQSRLVTLKDIQAASYTTKMMQGLLRVFAPLL